MGYSLESIRCYIRKDGESKWPWLTEVIISVSQRLALMLFYTKIEHPSLRSKEHVIDASP